MNHKHKPHHFMLAALLLTTATAHGEEIKLRNNGDACTSSNEGAIYYDDGDDTFYFCRNASTGWEAFEDLAPASSGGGAPTYAGLTSGSTDGTPTTSTGLKGMDAMCSATYTGSRMMRTSDMKYLFNSITDSSAYAWVYCDALTPAGSGSGCTNITADFFQGNITYSNCAGFTSNAFNANYKGLTYRSSSGAFALNYCNSSYRIHCVTD